MIGWPVNYNACSRFKKIKKEEEKEERKKEN